MSHVPPLQIGSKIDEGLEGVSDFFFREVEHGQRLLKDRGVDLMGTLAFVVAEHEVASDVAEQAVEVDRLVDPLAGLGRDVPGC